MGNNISIEKIRKSQIIDAAFKKITEIGIQNITMDDIAVEAGFSKGGIAYYYPSKDLLIKEAFREFFTTIFLRGKETMEQFAEPLDKILSFEWLYNWQDPIVHIGYCMLFDAMSMAAHDAEYRVLFHDWFNGWTSLLGSALEEGVKSGIFKIKDIKGTARAISAIYQGIATRWYLDKDSHSTEWAVTNSRKAITNLLRELKK
jgi:AcrR family transcriptional regulator